MTRLLGFFKHSPLKFLSIPGALSPYPLAHLRLSEFLSQPDLLLKTNKPVFLTGQAGHKMCDERTLCISASL